MQELFELSDLSLLSDMAGSRQAKASRVWREIFRPPVFGKERELRSDYYSGLYFTSKHLKGEVLFYVQNIM